MTTTQSKLWCRPLLVGGAVVLLGSIALTAPTRPTATLAGLLGYLLGVILLGFGWSRSGPMDRFGTANVVTLGRLVGTCWIVSLIAGIDSTDGIGWPAMWIALIGGGCLILDGVDGRLARSRGETSRFGARFDLEVDAATTLTLSVAVPAVGIAGWWVIVMGGLRYAYLVAGLLQPALRRPLPFSQSSGWDTARVIAGATVEGSRPRPVLWWR